MDIGSDIIQYNISKKFTYRNINIIFRDSINIIHLRPTQIQSTPDYAWPGNQDEKDFF